MYLLVTVEKLTINKFQFYIKPEAVVMVYNSQQVCFYNYRLRNKKKLGHFANELKESNRMDLNTIFSLARRYEVPSMSLDTSIDQNRNLNRIAV